MTLWQTLSSRVAFENPWIRIRVDDVVRPDGEPGEYGVIEMQHPAVFVVALTDQDEVVLIRLFRYTVGAESWEVPAGGSDGEDPLVAAQRELLEETGLTARTWTQLGTMSGLIGVADAREHVFLARDLVPASGAALAEEGITDVCRVPWPQVLQMIQDGEIFDGESVACLMYAALHLGRVG